MEKYSTRNITMKKLLTLLAVTLFSSTAFSAINLANITGYNLNASYPDGTLSLNHTYTGTISNGSLPGILDYTDGTGTLADGSIQAPNEGHFFFGNSASITIFLDNDYYIDNVFFYSALGKNSALKSASINGQTITSTSFGQIVFGKLQDDLFDLSGTGIETMGMSQITLSNFNFPFGTPKTFTLSEIQISGTLVSAVPEPSTYALMLGGLGLIGFMARRRRLV
jgi:hypothetical protein